MEADLTRTQWLPAGRVHAGMLLVDWHDEDGRGVFGDPPRARRITEVEISGGIVYFRSPEWTSIHAYGADRLVEVQHG